MPEGLGALCASLRADLALANVLTGKLPFGAPPAGPQKSDDLTLRYSPTLEPPGFFRAFFSAAVNSAIISSVSPQIASLSDFRVLPLATLRAYQMHCLNDVF